MTAPAPAFEGKVRARFVLPGNFVSIPEGTIKLGWKTDDWEHCEWNVYEVAGKAEAKNGMVSIPVHYGGFVLHISAPEDAWAYEWASSTFIEAWEQAQRA
jgi:hypothetical protein